jgi:hypothetical protein
MTEACVTDNLVSRKTRWTTTPDNVPNIGKIIRGKGH